MHAHVCHFLRLLLVRSLLLGRSRSSPSPDPSLCPPPPPLTVVARLVSFFLHLFVCSSCPPPIKAASSTISVDVDRGGLDDDNDDDGSSASLKSPRRRSPSAAELGESSPVEPAERASPHLSEEEDREEDPQDLQPAAVRRARRRARARGSPSAPVHGRIGMAAGVVAVVVERKGFDDALSGSIERLSMPSLHRNSNTDSLHGSANDDDDHDNDGSTNPAFGSSLSPGVVNLAQGTRSVTSLLKYVSGGMMAARRKRLKSNGRRVLLHRKAVKAAGREPATPTPTPAAATKEDPTVTATSTSIRQRKQQQQQQLEEVQVDVDAVADEDLPVGKRVPRRQLSRGERNCVWVCQ